MKTRKILIIEEADLKALIQTHDDKKPESKDVKITGAVPEYVFDEISGDHKYTVALSYEIYP